MGDPQAPQDHRAARFRAAWIRCFAPGAPLADPAVPDSPVFPLARTVEMPPGHAYPTGAVGLQWTGLHLEGLADLAVAAAADGPRWTLTLEGVTLRGRYRLEAKPDPVLDLDTAGNLMELRREARGPAVAGGGGGAPDPEAEQWLATARQQREALGQTDNGLQLIALYNQHNEVYEEVFRTSPTLPSNWQAGGVTRAMAADTNAAVQAGGTINPPDKDYGGGVTYNSNAFVQQLNVAVETVLSDPNFNPYEPLTQQNLHGKYWAAAKAALSFGKGVSESTGNTKSRVTAMAAAGVYQAVQSQSSGLPPVTDAEAKGVLGSAMAAGPGAGAPEAPGWIVIDEDDRRRVRSIVALRAKARAEDGAVRGETLFSGALLAEIGRVEAEVALEVDAASGRARAAGVRVTLPAFALEIDDTDWSGPVAEVARERLTGTFFLRGLLADGIRDRLAAVVGAAAARSHDVATGAA